MRHARLAGAQFAGLAAVDALRMGFAKFWVVRMNSAGVGEPVRSEGVQPELAARLGLGARGVRHLGRHGSLQEWLEDGRRAAPSGQKPCLAVDAGKLDQFRNREVPRDPVSPWPRKRVSS